MWVWERDGPHLIVSYAQPDVAERLGQNEGFALPPTIGFTTTPTGMICGNRVRHTASGTTATTRGSRLSASTGAGGGGTPGRR